MPIRLYIPQPLTAEADLDLPPGAARHAQVRRVQPGDTLLLFDGQGADWPAQVMAVGRSQVQVRVGQPVAVSRELPLQVQLAVGMPANERMDTLVEKATELGMSALQPLECERSVLRLAGERAQRKQAHWQAVAEAACEQCGRARLPRVAAVQTLAQWLAGLPAPAADAACAPLRLLLSPGEDSAPLQASVPAHCTGVLALSGPEGGLSAAEEAAALRAGFLRVGLGPRVLRADTAPLALLAWLGLRG
jgi:16S rRNA (uracil1498-N3)-methyltransferase